MPATKKTAAKKRVMAKKATATKVMAKKAAAGKPNASVSRSSTQPRPGDLIVIDSPQVGSRPREGEVLQVIQGDVSVSYRVKWADGHETVFSPALGSARFVRA